jgi:cysteinyl-tRNA synthetase
LAEVIREELTAAGKLDLADSIPVQALADAPADEAERLIDLLVSVRSILRMAREYAAADRIRTGLADLGIVVEDTAQGSTWRVATPS